MICACIYIEARLWREIHTYFYTLCTPYTINIHFNQALLAKWVWRFLVNKHNLWARVISARHGDLPLNQIGQSTRSGGSCNSGWWSKVLAAAGGNEAGFFWNNLSLNLGNGSIARFWYDKWAGDLTLKDQFPRLYQLCANKDGKVREMGNLIGDCWKWEIPWRRPLLQREIQRVDELLNLIQHLSVRDDVPDSWSWGIASSKEFTVKAAYAILARESSGMTSQRPWWTGFNRIWKSFAPLKAKLTAWRLTHDRLPTKHNLSKRFTFAPDNLLCCCCRLIHESAGHFFFSCNAVFNLWNKLTNWIGVCWAPPNTIQAHFEQFVGLLGGKKSRNRLGGLWICVIWVLWKWRNAVVFDDKDWNFNRIEEEIKCRFWSWCATRGDVASNLGFAEWCLYFPSYILSNL